MSTKLFTNRETNTLIQKFEGVFRYTQIHFFDALVGYFRASGYFRLRPFLDKVPKIRILVGINVDAIIATAQSEGNSFIKNENRTKEEFIAGIRDDIRKANYEKHSIILIKN